MTEIVILLFLSFFSTDLVVKDTRKYVSITLNFKLINRVKYKYFNRDKMKVCVTWLKCFQFLLDVVLLQRSIATVKYNFNYLQYPQNFLRILHFTNYIRKWYNAISKVISIILLKYFLISNSNYKV